MSEGCCDGLPEPIGGILRRRMALAARCEALRGRAVGGAP
jgi:hypothetical protein